MRIAIVIENGVTQLVLTPQDEHEKACLGQLHADGVELTVKRGSYYRCQGGWYRQGADDDSTILVMEKSE